MGVAQAEMGQLHARLEITLGRQAELREIRAIDFNRLFSGKLVLSQVAEIFDEDQLKSVSLEHSAFRLTRAFP